MNAEPNITHSNLIEIQKNVRYRLTNRQLRQKDTNNVQVVADEEQKIRPELISESKKNNDRAPVDILREKTDNQTNAQSDKNTGTHTLRFKRNRNRPAEQS